MRRHLAIVAIFVLGIASGSRTALAAHCSCKYLVNGNEVRTTTEGGYTQSFPGQNAKCDLHCTLELDRTKEEVARLLPNSCGQPATVRVLAAIGTARYHDASSATVNISCDTPLQPVAHVNQYAVKFVCGTSNATGSNSGITAPGRYFTAINLHNPTTQAIDFRRKFALALPGAEGNISTWFDGHLGPDGALEVDCPDILQRAGLPATSLAKGFAVFEPFLARQELDVVAVYSAGTDHVETLHIERVPPRDVVPAPNCRDLNLPLATDTTRWTVTEVPPTLTGVPAVPFAPFAFTSGGVSWITGVNTANNSGASGPGGFYTYEFRFCLCQGFSNPVLTLTLTTDNESDIRLNGPSIGTTSENLIQNTVTTNNASLFTTGTNILTIRVRNRGIGGDPTQATATGLTATGTMTAKNGQCP